MKHKRVSLLAIVLSLCLLIFACRKLSNIVYTDSPQSTVLDEAKLWHTQQTQGQDPKKILRPRWSQASSIMLSNGSSAIIVPAKEHKISDPRKTIRRFFVFKIKGNTILSGNIVELLGVDYNITDNLQTLLPKLESGNIPGFTGSIIKYDIRYHNPVSRVFSKGILIYGSTYIISKATPEKLNRLIPAVIQSGPKLKPMGGTWVDGYYFDEYCTYQIDTVNGQVVGITELGCDYPTTTNQESSNSGSASSSGNGENSPPYGGDTSDDKDCAGVHNGTAFISPCGCMGGTTGIMYCDPKDPCNEKNILNRRYNTVQEVIMQQGALLVTKSDPGKKERGWNRKLPSISDNANDDPTSLIDYKVHTGDTLTYNFDKTWDPVNGYWIGGNHTHYNNSGPSPEDFLIMNDFLVNPAFALSSRPTAEKEFYKSEAVIGTVTDSATYMMNVSNWTKLDSVYHVYLSNPGAFDQRYRDLKTAYQLNNSHNKYLAGAAALLQLFPNAINIFYGNYALNTGIGGNNITFAPLRIKPGLSYVEMEKNPCN